MVGRDSIGWGRSFTIYLYSRSGSEVVKLRMQTSQVPPSLACERTSGFGARDQSPNAEVNKKTLPLPKNNSKKRSSVLRIELRAQH